MENLNSKLQNQRGKTNMKGCNTRSVTSNINWVLYIIGYYKRKWESDPEKLASLNARESKCSERPK